MFETYFINDQECSWEMFKETIEKHSDLSFRDGKKMVTMKQFLTKAKPQFRLKKIKFAFRTSMMTYSPLGSSKYYPPEVSIVL